MKHPKVDPHSNIKRNDVKNAIKGVIQFVSQNSQLQSNLFKEDFPIFLQINSFKIPKASGIVKQVFRVPLANSPLPPDADICLIVPDVKGIPNKEHERHLEHYENLLTSKDVTGIKKIMTFHEFRTEYDTFELKNRLVDLYDAFLVDGRISGKVVHKSGSIFYKKRKLPLSVKLHLPKLKSHLDEALKKAFFHFNLKSDSHIVQIGHNKMKVNDLVENVFSVVEFIEKQFPGNMENVRSLNVYAYRGSSIPIYLSLKSPNTVEVPKLGQKKPKAYKTFKGELTTKLNSNVIVKPSGAVIVEMRKVNRRKKENYEDEAVVATEPEETDELTKTKKGKKRKLSKELKPTEPEKKPKIPVKNENMPKTDVKKKKASVEATKPKQEAITNQKSKKSENTSNKTIKKIKKEKTLDKVASVKVIKPKMKKKKKMS